MAIQQAMHDPQTSRDGAPATAPEALSYWIDAWQRSVLYWDVMRRRGNAFIEHNAETAPHVLKFEGELVVDGRQLARPVNYGLVRIVPPEGTTIDPVKRPFVVIDPRAGHGPGIGGFKADSEIGVALKAGHACYLVGFLPEPVPGQTIEDVMLAEAAFLERVIALHPEAEGKPAVIGNCQAGWAVMMLASLRPELCGPIIIAGSPLSYWAGVRGVNPMRYSGGLLGGSWLTALTGDLGNGRFDGAWLVANFENLNPANTFWTKQYNLYSKIDTEAPRYLDFEQYWGGYVNLNAEEIQFIVDELFIGNRLSTGEIATSDGVRIDLRNIRSPVLVFCSRGDNITPPQQALGWILDLYDSVDDLRANGQTIVYAIHESIGHLGIFVSGSVAKKEHDEFESNIDLIDVLPPGLYEAVLAPKDESIRGAELIAGDYMLRVEQRDLDDLRALGVNSVEDDRKFAAVARVSEINLGLYRTFLQPWVRAFATDALADWMHRAHPLRLQFVLPSDANPVARPTAEMAAEVRRNRRPAGPGNAFLRAEKTASQWIEQSLRTFGEVRDRLGEELFHAVYGSPVLQAMVGLKAREECPRPRPATEAGHFAEVSRRIAELEQRIAEGGPREAAVRAILHLRMADGATADERGLAILRRLRDEHGGGMSLPAFKQLVREQYLMLLVDERRALEAIPAMLARDPDGARSVARQLAPFLDVIAPESDAGRARALAIRALLEASGVMAPALTVTAQARPRRRPARRAAAGARAEGGRRQNGQEAG
jgi:pimeloyl-ACP methyl ester carboxylesterase